MALVNVDVCELKELIKTRFMQGLAQPKCRPRNLYIEGHAGIGKTQVARQCAEELTAQLREKLGGRAIEFRILNLQFMERPDFMGLAYVDETKRTRFATPLMLPTEGFGILLLDEANRVDADIRSGLLTLLEDREINGHKLGDGWLILLAGNPAETADGEGQYEVGTFDAALLDRVSRVILKPSIQGLIEFLEAKYGKDQKFVEFLRKNPNFVSFNGNGISPRSFEYMIRAVHGVDDMKLLRRIVSADAGVENALQIMQFLLARTISYSDILGANEIEKNEQVKKIFDRPDMIGFLLDEIIVDLEARAKKGKIFEERERSNLIFFLNKVPNENKVSLAVKMRNSKIAGFFYEQLVRNTPLAFTFAQMFSGQVRS